MPYSIRHDSTHGIAELTYSGTLTGEELRTATAEAIALQKQTGALNFLICIDAEVTASIIDVFVLPTKTYGQEEVDPRTRMALVLPAVESARQRVLFFEDACRNRGWNARVLPDRRSA